MKAVIYDAFGERPEIRELPDPAPAPDGVVIRVMATGVCRSDWHGWQGHDPDITPPHVPGHELAGIVEAVGREVAKARAGDRVTVPFVCACGRCPQCRCGNHQVCDDQFQPGFTHWGSFARFVAIERADLNLVPLPESMDFVTAASLGCRFATSFRAIVDQGRLEAGQWVAVHGCGGVGLSATMIAAALEANVVAIDVADDRLDLARRLGAVAGINAREVPDVVDAVRQASSGGVHLSIDALGDPATCFNSIANLRKRGRHIQVGLMVGEHQSPPIPMSRVIANELEVLGSHGMQAHRYGALLAMIEAGQLTPQALIGRTVDLEQSIDALVGLPEQKTVGITVVTGFD